MQDLKNRYYQFKEQMPSHGDIIVLSYAVHKMKYPKVIITKVFDSCVSKEEYDKEDRSEIINHLFDYSDNTVK